MKNTSNVCTVGLFAAAAIIVCGSANAADTNGRQTTPNLEYGQVLKIRLPMGMCEFDEVVPAYVVNKLSTRRDWNRLVEYMLINCPSLGLPLADTATASISGPAGASGAGGNDGGPNFAGGSSDTGGSESTGASNDTGGAGGSDDDGNNGHGNDADGHDESNPGGKR